MATYEASGGVVYLNGKPIATVKPPANCYGLADGDLVQVAGKLYFFRGLVPSVVNPPPAPPSIVAVLRPIGGVKFYPCGCGLNCGRVMHETETYHADPLDCEIIISREFRS